MFDSYQAHDTFPYIFEVIFKESFIQFCLLFSLESKGNFCSIYIVDVLYSS